MTIRNDGRVERLSFSVGGDLSVGAGSEEITAWKTFGSDMEFVIVEAPKETQPPGTLKTYVPKGK